MEKTIHLNRFYIIVKKTKNIIYLGGKDELKKQN